jgi:hypothetical protein
MVLFEEALEKARRRYGFFIVGYPSRQGDAVLLSVPEIERESLSSFHRRS